MHYLLKGLDNNIIDEQLNDAITINKWLLKNPPQK